MKIRQANGQIITEPGIYSDIDTEDYHHNPFLCDAPSISSSAIKQMVSRPSLYWSGSPYNKNRIVKEPSPEMVFGKAAHLLLLEDGYEFDKQFIVRPDTYPDDVTKKWSGNSIACKEWLQHAADNNLLVLKTEHMEIIGRIRDQLAKHPIVKGGIFEGKTETSMIGKFGNVYLRARPDKIPEHSGDFADLKTAANIEYAELERAIARGGYHIQAAVCKIVAEQVMPDGFTFNGFAFVFVEKTEPFDVRILQLRDEDIELGERQVRQALHFFEACISRWEWPSEEGFAPSINYIGLPTWARARIETELQLKELEK